MVLILLTMAGAIAVLWGRSFWAMDGYSSGTWEFGIVSGDVIAVKATRFEGSVNWPFMYCEASELRLVSDIARQRWGFSWDYPLYMFLRADERFDLLEDTWPDWGATYTVRIPLWLIGAATVLPWMGLSAARRLRQNRMRRCRGFPIQPIGGN
jgi:hypothetical protein